MTGYSPKIYGKWFNVRHLMEIEGNTFHLLNYFLTKVNLI